MSPFGIFLALLERKHPLLKLYNPGLLGAISAFVWRESVHNNEANIKERWKRKRFQPV